jgi:hypothetical protein
VSARFESSTCRNCGGQRCIHCNYRGVFLKRLSPNPRLEPERSAVLRFLRSGSAGGSLEGVAGVPERRLT